MKAKIDEKFEKYTPTLGGETAILTKTGSEYSLHIYDESASQRQRESTGSGEELVAKQD